MKTENTLKLNSIKKANEQEIEQIVKSKWQDPKMQDFLKKSYDFYILKDGYFFEVEKYSKISIHKTMWYDDETEGPENNENNFISYNLKMSDPFDHIQAYLDERERLQKMGCATGRYDYKGFYIEIYRTDTKEIYISFYDENRGQKIRYLTEEEQNDYIAIKKDIKEKYIERLKKYYKRYNNHVHASGYWVNR